jgi:hypothetical protein
MAVFEYRGLLVASGKTVHDVRDADNPKALRAMLKREGILLTEANEVNRAKNASSGGGGLFAFFRRVSVTDVAMMTRQLATLVGAGIPLVEAVTALTEQVEKEEMKRVLALVRDRLNEGSSLAKALEAHPKVFPPLYVNMVAAGEASGTLEVVLDRLSDFMENQARLKGKVSAALAYPILMLIIGTVLITVMMIVVVPKVTSIFASLDRALPWYTAVLIFISNAVSSNVTLGTVLSLVGTTFVRRAIAPGPSRNGFVVAALVAFGVLFLSAFAVESVSLLGLGVFFGLVLGVALGQFLTFVATPQGQLWKDGVALRAGEARDARRAADAREQEVGGGVVADGHRDPRELADGHRAVGHAGPRRGGVLEQVGGAVGDARVERERAAVDLREHGGRERPLEGGAHRETLVGALGDVPAGARVEREHAQAPADARFEGGEGALRANDRGVRAASAGDG